MLEPSRNVHSHASGRLPRRSAALAFVLVVAELVIALGVTSGAWAQYAGGLTLSDSVATAGSTISIKGQGFAPLTKVTITFESEEVELGGASTNSAGSFSKRVTVPPDAAPGKHTIRATGEARGGGKVSLSASVTIKPGPAARGASPLRAVGIGAAIALAALGLLVAVGRVVRRPSVPSA